MTWKKLAHQLWPLVDPHIPDRPGDPAKGGRPRIPDETVFEKLVLFLRAGCSWEAFDEFLNGSGVSGTTCHRRFALRRDHGVFELVF